MVLTCRSAIGWTLVSCLAVPFIAVGQVIDGGQPNPDYANLYAWYNGETALGADGIAETPIWPEHRGIDAARAISSGFGFGGDPKSIDIVTVNNGRAALRHQHVVSWSIVSDWGALFGDQTIFVVADVADTTTAALFGSNAAGSPTRVDATGGEWMVYGADGSFSSGAVTTNALQVHSFVFRSDGESQHFINGTLAGSGTIGFTDFDGFVYSGFQNAVNTATDTTFAEMLIYDVALSESDRQSIEGYLDDRFFGATALLCDGDADSDCDFDDLVAMYAGTALVDLDGDGSAGVGDVTTWLDAASTTQNTANPNALTFRNGDLDLDGKVDSSDLGRLLNNFGVSAATAADGPQYAGGDLDINGNVSSDDLGVLLNQFGFESTPAASAASAVPEPSGRGVCLFVLAGFAALAMRRRRCSGK